MTPVRVVDGTLKIRNREHCDAGLKALRNGEYLMRLEKFRATRSNDLNRLYFVAYVRPMAEHTGYTTLEMHAVFKSMFLPKKHFVIHDKNGAVVNETDIDTLTTTTLTTDEFKDYLREIEAFAQTLNVRVGSNRDDE